MQFQCLTTPTHTIESAESTDDWRLGLPADQILILCPACFLCAGPMPTLYRSARYPTSDRVAAPNLTRTMPCKPIFIRTMLTLPPAAAAVPASRPVRRWAKIFTSTSARNATRSTLASRRSPIAAAVSINSASASALAPPSPTRRKRSQKRPVLPGVLHFSVSVFVITTGQPTPSHRPNYRCRIFAEFSRQAAQ